MKQPKELNVQLSIWWRTRWGWCAF